MKIQAFKFFVWWLFMVSSTGFAIAQENTSTILLKKFEKLTDATPWKQSAAIPLQFPAHHPQGMIKVGSNYYLSAVEVINRADGKGVGHLYKFDEKGKLLADVKLGDGVMYHPGGIDYDGQFIWVPVAEYRPKSHSIVYKLNPETLEISEVFRFNDHLGGIVHDIDANTLHAVSWGSRLFYEWKLDANGKIQLETGKPDSTGFPNASFYIDYQDCHYGGNHKMLCGGLKNYNNGTVIFRLGGMELVDLNTHLPIHQIPFPYWSPSGKPMTQNPFWLESTATGLKGYFIPDDNEAVMYVYEAELGK